MNPNQLAAGLSQTSAGLRRCECGSVVVMAYEPGCIYIRCLAEKKTVMAEPDWNPSGLAGRWNDRRLAFADENLNHAEK